jgi:hypothetical protein
VQRVFAFLWPRFACWGKVTRVFSRPFGGRATAWLLVAVFGVLGGFAVLRAHHTGSPDAPPAAGQPRDRAAAVPLPGAVPLAAPPAPLPGESATGGSPTGELTVADRPAGPPPPPAPPGPSGIPSVPFAAYQRAEHALAATVPGCGLSWTVLAAIGRAETADAMGGRVDAHGRTFGRILGPRLDGSPGLPRVPDSDGGRLDGDPVYDRAVGPMQLAPATWRRYGADGDGDGTVDPNDMFDAALTAGRYLCAGGADLSNAQQRVAALYRYNHSDSFVTAVRNWAAGYAQGAAKVPTFPSAPSAPDTVEAPVISAPGGAPVVGPHGATGPGVYQPVPPAGARSTPRRDLAAPPRLPTHRTGAARPAAAAQRPGSAPASPPSPRSVAEVRPNRILPPSGNGPTTAGAPSDPVAMTGGATSAVSPSASSPSASGPSAGSSGGSASSGSSVPSTGSVSPPSASAGTTKSVPIIVLPPNDTGSAYPSPNSASQGSAPSGASSSGGSSNSSSSDPRSSNGGSSSSASSAPSR